VAQQGQAAQRANLTLDQISEILRGQLGDESIRGKGLKTALLKDGAPIGKHDAVVAVAPPTGGGGGQVEVKHALGRVPGYCRILQVVPPVGATCHVSVAPVKYESWTDTTIRVDLYHVAIGSMDGAIVYLEIGGERVA
jgi:hypothetical protein